MVVLFSPTADLNSVSNLAWSCAVMKDSLIFGILFDVLGGALAAAECTSGAPPVRKDAAIAEKPVG